ncbi:MAG: (Fe-S)-binding protein [Gammaproteobacteria bacterium]|nr:(Fe-S)-binding protein [Gammaproteobacteria bacterium]MCB1922491.1 (Fe-S)-binding protein [Gammaproteobacteria bacterium]
MAVDMNVFRGFAEQIGSLPQMAQPTDCPDGERVSRAKAVFAAKLDSAKATHLESCIHCGLCAEACQFYLQTKDPELTPIHKLDLLKRYYRREKAPLRFFHRFFEADISEADLEATQFLVYESCTECGRCGLVCPMGIDIASMVNVTRQGLAEAGLIPAGLRAVEQEQGGRGTVFGVGPEQLRAAIDDLRGRGYDVPIDKPKADILVLTSTIDILLFKDALEATVKVMNHLGVDWTLHSCAFEGANFGLLSGYEQVQKSASERITTQAIALGAKLVIVPECGHAYPALRWEGANEHGGALPFEVMAISEFLGNEIAAGRLQVEPIGRDKHVTYHDPCKVGRHGGVFREPRVVLDALGVDLDEMPCNQATNFCCGGGAGLFVMERAEPMRNAAFDLKREQVESTRADTVVTACGSCRVNLLAGAMRTEWDRGVESLVELVGNNLKQR